MTVYREALKEHTRDNAPLDLANTQMTLASMLHILGMRETGMTRLAEAETIFREVLQEFSREKMPLKWARAQRELALTLQIHGEREGNGKRLEEAVAAYLESLKVFSLEKTPQEWAETQINLAFNLRLLHVPGTGAKWKEEAVAYTALIKEVATAYRGLLKVYDREEMPRLWAQAQIDLGDALKEGFFWISDDDDARLKVFEDSNAAYREALSLFTQDKAPSEWAAIQSKLGNLLSQMGNVSKDKTQAARFNEMASASYREALKVYTPEKTPFGWANAQSSLGRSLLSLGKYEEAVAAHREALKANIQGQAPKLWANTQSGIGNSLEQWGQQQSGTTHLKEAVTAYREALKEYRLSSDISSSFDLSFRSHLEESLGDVIATLSDREADTEWLEQETAAYRRALFTEEIIRNGVDGEGFRRQPFQMAMLQHKLGNVFLRRGMRETDTSFLLEALAIYREALKNATQAVSQYYPAMIQGHLGDTLTELGLRENNATRLNDALAAYLEADKDAFGLPPNRHVQTQFSGWEKMTARLQQAVAAYREALRKTSREKKPGDWVKLQEQLGDALFILCWWDESARGVAHLEEAVAAYLGVLQSRPGSPFTYLKLGSAVNMRTRYYADEEELTFYRKELKKVQEPKGESAPLARAIVQESLGNLLSRNRKHNTMELKEAVVAYQEALKEYKALGLPQQIKHVRSNLRMALISLGDLETGTDRLEEALALCREELKDYPKETAPFDWKRAQVDMAAVLTKIGERESGTKRLEEAVNVYREVLKGYEGKKTMISSDYFAWDGLGDTLKKLGEKITGTERLEEAVTAYQNALDGRRKENASNKYESEDDYFIKETENKQRAVRELLAKRMK